MAIEKNFSRIVVKPRARLPRAAVEPLEVLKKWVDVVFWDMVLVVDLAVSGLSDLRPLFQL